MKDKRVALVTGANQGIGLQIAKELVAHGFTVLVGSRDQRSARLITWWGGEVEGTAPFAPPHEKGRL